MTQILNLGSQTAWLIVYVLLFVVTVTGNVMILVTLATTPRLRTTSNVYLATLAVADLFVGLNKMSFIFWINTDTHRYFEDDYLLCQVFVMITFAACIASVFTLLVIASDRFVYIMFPFLYQRIVTMKRVSIISLASFPVYVTYAGLLRFLDPGPDIECTIDTIFPKSALITYINCCVFFMIGAAIGCLYAVIFCKAAAQAKAIDAVSASVQAEKNVRLEKRKIARNVRLLKRMVLVWGLFVMAWTPYFVVTVLRFRLYISDDVKLVIAVIASSNSIFNFVVYSFEDSEFRSAIGRLLTRASKRRVSHRDGLASQRMDNARNQVVQEL